MCGWVNNGLPSNTERCLQCGWQMFCHWLRRRNQFHSKLANSTLNAENHNEQPNHQQNSLEKKSSFDCVCGFFFVVFVASLLERLLYNERTANLTIRVFCFFCMRIFDLFVCGEYILILMLCVFVCARSSHRAFRCPKKTRKIDWT